MTIEIHLKNDWIDVNEFEQCYSKAISPFNDKVSCFHIACENRTKLLIDAILRLLCLCNQLSFKGKSVKLDFSKNHDLLTYLNRCGFFDNLSDRVDVLPYRPSESMACRFNGQSSTLVEIAKVQSKLTSPQQARTIPSLLCDKMNHNIEKIHKNFNIINQNFHDEMFTILSEVCGNVWQHSKSELVGFACLQFYGHKNKLVIAVSDSGIGLLESLKPALKFNYPNRLDLHNISDEELILHMFQEGLSSKPLQSGRGAGLSRCAELALRHKMQLHVRTKNISATLKPALNEAQKNLATFQVSPNPIDGTHISFEFILDNLQL